MDIRDSDFFLEEETLRTMKTLSEQVSVYLGQVTITMQEMYQPLFLILILTKFPFK